MNHTTKAAAKWTYDTIEAFGGKAASETWTMYGSANAKLVCGAMRLYITLNGLDQSDWTDEELMLGYMNIRKKGGQI